jgi:hypothetical protein
MNDCLRIAGLSDLPNDFASRRRIVLGCVEAIRVHTIHSERPKVGLVTVTYKTGEVRVFRFARGPGALL